MSKKNKGIRVGSIVRIARATKPQTYEVLRLDQWDKAVLALPSDHRERISDVAAEHLIPIGYKGKKQRRIESLERSLAQALTEKANSDHRAHEVGAERERIQRDKYAKMISGGLVPMDLLRNSMTLVNTQGDGSGYAETTLKIIEVPGNPNRPLVSLFLNELAK